MNLSGLTASLLAMAAEVETLKRKAVADSIKIVEKAAKDRIGDYQPAVGPVAAWDPLAQSTQDDRVQKGYTPDDPLERTGELKTNITSFMQGDLGYVGSPDEKALYAEVGTPTEPARSWLEGGYYDVQGEVIKRIGVTTVQVLTK